VHFGLCNFISLVCAISKLYLCRYVDVILQLIDKAGDFVSDDIWYRVVQFVTNNEDLQPYAAAKAREYLDKPAIHETMVKVFFFYQLKLLYYEELQGY